MVEGVAGWVVIVCGVVVVAAGAVVVRVVVVGVFEVWMMVCLVNLIVYLSCVSWHPEDQAAPRLAVWTWPL